MIGTPIFIFLFVMWVLMILGGGILVFAIAPITISGFEEWDKLFSKPSDTNFEEESELFTLNFSSVISSIIKAVISIVLVVVWIVILIQIKNWIFKKQITS